MRSPKPWRGASAVLAGAALPVALLAGVANAAPATVRVGPGQVTGVVKRLTDTHSFEAWVQNTGTGDLSQVTLKETVYVPATATLTAAPEVACTQTATGDMDAIYTCSFIGPLHLAPDGLLQMATVTDPNYEWGIVDGGLFSVPAARDADGGSHPGHDGGKLSIVTARLVPAVDDETVQALEGTILGTCCCCCCTD
ncbi:hypothetical protein [Streptomyces sp. NPDC086787]|uniref:hypothetical protein n=1 Tax=Streptomyces sp. NPDC086787 TaxID=3365759 RepID=UPI0038037892